MAGDLFFLSITPYGKGRGTMLCWKGRHLVPSFIIVLLLYYVLSALSLSVLPVSSTVPSRGVTTCVARDFFVGRNVTVRKVSWLGRGGEMLPLQIYRGSAVGPRKRRDVSLDELLAQGEDQLSVSARKLLQGRDRLNEQERRLLENKIQAEAKASEPLDSTTDLNILYLDNQICVTSKPSGILSVPGPRRNPSLSGLVHELVKPDIDIDQMVVHRLDLDTSGVLVYALTEAALKRLHIDFRDRRVHKEYEALLAGHFKSSAEVEIDVSLERDPFHPPFMRAAQPKDGVNIDTVHPSFRKFIEQAPKASQTELHVLSMEYLPGGLPVTRVRLIPKTGRTHQLRVHCASLGYPIVGDDIYGYQGAGNCGIHFNDEQAQKRLTIQRWIYEQGHSLCLHAKKLCFYHPGTGAPLIFESSTPF